jgi:hypothetical protein
MAVTLDVSDDFSIILDGAEPITLARRDGAETIAVAKAWRYSQFSTEVEGTGGHVVLADVVWQLAWDWAVELPRVGDLVVDQDERAGIVLSVAQHLARTRLRLQTRELRVSGPNARVDIQQAVWDDLGGGPEIVAWLDVDPSVPAWIQPVQTIVDTLADPVSSTTDYRVYLGKPVALDHNHRLIAADGTIYELVEFSGAGRIDVWGQATVRKAEV